ncbi:tubulin folding cofactor A [Recurvomyces mirabilis]|uniref:Tubulin-specific chaperone A n=1 Tax=Recurvomyces mirabilis TaxID=574656 RepID=A0AAE0WMI3_9PEZI|nr:tubulin folding cofactor A [Recurvomyces mirabilis]KAK5158477.1 tubulin folding cofactor A [Recurvomyces mirabilis]
MPPPSQLAIATSSLNRLVKEEASYHKELEQQQASIAKLEQGGGDENAEYTLRQERRAVEETKAIFPQLKLKIEDALSKLEQQLEQESQGDAENVAKAKEAVAAGKKALG